MAAPFSLAAEFSPEIAAFLVSAGGRQQLASLVRGRDERLREKLRKHLVAMGWSIATKYNSVMAPRLRYHSPPDDDAKTTYYDSLPHLVLHYYGQDQKAEHGEDVDVHETRIFEEEKDAIGEYIALMAAQPRAQGSRVERLRADVKRQLESAGWSLWMKLKSDGREELRYKSPINGRSYMSLHTACLAFVSQSESTEGNEKKRKAPPATHVDVFTKSSTIIKRKKGTAIKKCTTTTTRRKNIRTISELLRDSDDDDTLMIKKKRSSTTTTTTSKRKKAKTNDGLHHPHQTTRVLRPRGEDKHDGNEKRRSSRTLLSVLMDKKILMRRDMKKVTCTRAARGSPPLKRGVITSDGLIRCECCNKAFTVAEFDAHSSSSTTTSGPGWGRNVFLEDGRSLAQCLIQLRKKSMVGSSSMGLGVRVRVKSKCTDLEGDSVCSICHDGGELLLCDHCPSTFHHDCLGLPCLPAGDDDWSCPCCRCAICDQSDFDPDIGFTDKTIIYCDQCERECHVGCLQGGGGGGEGEVPWSSWLCSDECSKVFHHLQRLVGAPAVATEMEGVSFVVLRSSSSEKDEDSEAKAEQHGELCAALDVLHECFVPLIEPRTQSDLVADMLFNRESDLRRLHFRGYYAVGLEKGGELVTVGTLQVYGDKVAELPLVGTRFAHRRQGMCRLLVKEVERMLAALGVNRLVLPSVPELLQTWTGPSFGFKPMTHSDKLDMVEHTILCFQGTTMCQKFLQPPNSLDP
jgi:hypothetical protein